MDFWDSLPLKIRDALTPYAEPLWRDQGDGRILSYLSKRTRLERDWLRHAIEYLAPLAEKHGLDDSPLLWLTDYTNGGASRDACQVKSACDLLRHLTLKETGRLVDYDSFPEVENGLEAIELTRDEIGVLISALTPVGTAYKSKLKNEPQRLLGEPSSKGGGRNKRNSYLYPGDVKWRLEAEFRVAFPEASRAAEIINRPAS